MGQKCNHFLEIKWYYLDASGDSYAFFNLEIGFNLAFIQR